MKKMLDKLYKTPSNHKSLYLTIMLILELIVLMIASMQLYVESKPVKVSKGEYQTSVLTDTIVSLEKFKKGE